MAVALKHRPAEALPLCGKVAQRHYLVGRSVELNLVVVHDGDEVIELELCCAHCGLPDNALVQLAVAENGVDLRRGLVELERHRHALSGGEALTEGASGHLDAGGVHIGVARKAAHTAQGGHLLNGEEALLRQIAVEHRGGVALGEHQTVAVGVVGVVCVNIHVLLIQIGEYLAHRERASRMSGLCRVDSGQNIDSEASAQLVELCNTLGSQSHCLVPP